MNGDGLGDMKWDWGVWVAPGLWVAGPWVILVFKDPGYVTIIQLREPPSKTLMINDVRRTKIDQEVLRGGPSLYNWRRLPSLPKPLSSRQIFWRWSIIWVDSEPVKIWDGASILRNLTEKCRSVRARYPVYVNYTVRGHLVRPLDQFWSFGPHWSSKGYVIIEHTSNVM